MDVILSELWQVHSVQIMVGSALVSLVWCVVLVTHVMLAIMDSHLLVAHVRMLTSKHVSWDYLIKTFGGLRNAAEKQVEDKCFCSSCHVHLTSETKQWF